MLSAQNTFELSLWPAGAPNSNGLTGTEEDLEGGRVANVITPSITVYKADKPNGVAIIMCPGGGYARLAMNHEGHDMAPWLNAQGITYIVLKYRMPNGHYEVPLSDAEQAIRLVRQHAKEWNIRPDRIGIMGASAGGHLAASLATLYSSNETRPDFQVLFYPVISMVPGVTHGGSRQNLLGNNPSQELEDKYTLEKQVNAHTPKPSSCSRLTMEPYLQPMASITLKPCSNIRFRLHCMSILLVATAGGSATRSLTNANGQANWKMVARRT